MSGGPASCARGQTGFGIVLNMRAERALLDWISVNWRSCAVRLDVPVRVNSSRLERRRFFVESGPLILIGWPSS